MSKFSPKENISRKLEESMAQAAELALGNKDALTLEESAALSPDVFTFAEYDEMEAERIGYSNYSYWRSTFRMFFKNKTAVAMLSIMLLLLVFTFIQPILPNQFDPNQVNYYDPKAVWIDVTEDGVANLSGVKYTKGDYACELKDGETLAYVKVPESWGTPKAVVRDKDGVSADLPLTVDPNNTEWYYAPVSADMPFMYVTSADGTETTYHQAVWVVYDEASGGVFSYSTKKTAGDLIQGAPDGTVLTYFQMPESWGTPKVIASTVMMGSAQTELEVIADPNNAGWYYAFVPAEQMMMDIYSADGSVKALNKGVAKVGNPAEIKPQVGFVENQRPNEIFWFGTNDIGQDLWSRMWSGTRTSLLIGITVALVEAVVGILAGLL